MFRQNHIYLGDTLEVLKTLPNEIINCCITSPPYWGLRDYGVNGQIGLEKTPEEYVQKLVHIFSEVKRVLKPEGTLWLNLGDSYAGSGKGAANYPKNSKKYRQGTNKGMLGKNAVNLKLPSGYKSKDLIGFPWMVAFALRNDGWYLRQDIIWHKPNPMPESVTDRCTKSHEYFFLLSKSKKYYFAQNKIKQPLKDSSIARLAQNIENQKGSNRVSGKINGSMKAVAKKFDKSMAGGGSKIKGHSGYFDKNGNFIGSSMANKKSVWTVTTKPFKEAHFATFPEELIIDCVRAGCPINGIVLDPFMGSGTTAIVAKKQNKGYIGIELNPKYIEIANERINKLK